MSKIKSEKAKEMIDLNTFNSNSDNEAESDARNMAVRARMKSCEYYENGYCGVSCVIDANGHPTTMHCGNWCEDIIKFKQACDNE